MSLLTININHFNGDASPIDFKRDEVAVTKNIVVEAKHDRSGFEIVRLVMGATLQAAGALLVVYVAYRFGWSDTTAKFDCYFPIENNLNAELNAVAEGLRSVFKA